MLIVVCFLILCAASHLLLQRPLPSPISATDLQDLLLVAVNLSNPESGRRLLSHMESQKQLLYADSSDTSDHSTSTSSSMSSVQLLEHLLTTAIVRGHCMVLQTLVATPAAQRLGLQAVTQLLTLSIQREHHGALIQQSDVGQEDVGNGNEGLVADGLQDEPDDLYDRNIGYLCFDVLLELPAVQSISGSTIANLLRLAVEQKLYEWGWLLCRLPGAQQLPLQQLFELLLQLLLPQREGRYRDAQRFMLTLSLKDLQATREMAPGAAMQLISTLIQVSSKQRGQGFLYGVEAAGVLAAVGSQLTGGEVLQLLHQAAELGCSDAVLCIAGLAAADNINDAEGFAVFVKAALARTEDYIWLAAVQELPVMQQLGPDAVLSLIQACISQAVSKPTGLMKYLVCHPAVNNCSTAALEEVLLAAAEQHQLGMVADLFKAPAAAGMSAETVGKCLQHAAHGMLARLTAHRLPPHAVVNVLSVAIETRNRALLNRAVCELPSAQQISAEAAAALLQRAAQQGYAVWNTVRSGLPQLAQQQLTSEQLRVFLQHAIAVGDSEGLSKLCHLAAAAEVLAAAAAAAAEGVAAGGISATAMQILLLNALHGLS
jgi:hypothetical protein